jgi:hypothetical protein
MENSELDERINAKSESECTGKQAAWTAKQNFMAIVFFQKAF